MIAVGLFVLYALEISLTTVCISFRNAPTKVSATVQLDCVNAFRDSPGARVSVRRAQMTALDMALVVLTETSRMTLPYPRRTS